MTDSKREKLKLLKTINLDHLNKAEAKEFTVLLEELEKREFQEKSTSTFMEFVRAMWSEFIDGDHHKQMAAAFDEIASRKTRLARFYRRLASQTYSR